MSSILLPKIAGIYGTEHWQELRYQAWKRADGHCERCDRLLEPGEWHLHHRTYVHAGADLLSEVEAICVPCHQAEHPSKPIRNAKGIRQQERERKRQERRELRAEKRRLTRKKPRRRPRKDPPCPLCLGKLSIKDHQRQCLGIKPAPR